MPELGARELKRRIQSEIENELAREMLAGEVHEGDTVRVEFDKKAGKVLFEKQSSHRGTPKKRTPAHVM